MSCLLWSLSVPSNVHLPESRLPGYVIHQHKTKPSGPCSSRRQGHGQGLRSLRTSHRLPWDSSVQCHALAGESCKAMHSAERTRAKSSGTPPVGPRPQGCHLLPEGHDVPLGLFRSIVSLRTGARPSGPANSLRTHAQLCVPGHQADPGQRLLSEISPALPDSWGFGARGAGGRWDRAVSGRRGAAGGRRAAMASARLPVSSRIRPESTGLAS